MGELVLCRGSEHEPEHEPAQETQKRCCFAGKIALGMIQGLAEPVLPPINSSNRPTDGPQTADATTMDQPWTKGTSLESCQRHASLIATSGNLVEHPTLYYTILHCTELEP